MFSATTARINSTEKVTKLLCEKLSQNGCLYLYCALALFSKTENAKAKIISNITFDGTINKIVLSIADSP